MSDVVLERIAGWESAGLIDAATAERLRAAEIASDAHDGPPAAPSRAGVASSFFGPPVSIVEAFSYLGVAFVLAAWSVLIGRLNGEAAGSTTTGSSSSGWPFPRSSSSRSGSHCTADRRA